MIKALISGKKQSHIRLFEKIIDRSVIDFETFIDDIENHDKFDIIVPITLNDYDYLQKQDDSILKKCLIPDDKTVQLCNDKIKFNQYIVNLGLEGFIPKPVADNVYPYIYKRNKDTNGFNSAIIKNRIEEIEFEKQNYGHEIFKQEYIFGNKEYTLHFISYQGKILYSSSRLFWFDEDLYVKGFHYKNYFTDTFISNPYISLFRKIIEQLQYTGTGSMNYKLQNGVPKVMELNPRFGGSLAAKINSYLLEYARAVKYANNAQTNRI